MRDARVDQWTIADVKLTSTFGVEPNTARSSHIGAVWRQYDPWPAMAPGKCHERVGVAP